MFLWLFLAGFVSRQLTRFYIPPNYAVSVTNINIGNTGESNKDNSTVSNLPLNIFGLPGLGIDSIINNIEEKMDGITRDALNSTFQDEVNELSQTIDEYINITLAEDALNITSHVDENVKVRQNAQEDKVGYDLSSITGNKKKTNKIKRPYSHGKGEDERPAKNTTESDDYVLLNITKFMNQMNLLTILESDKVSVNEKISAIKKYKKDNNDDGYIVKLKAGGLFKDWDNSSQNYF